MESIQLSESVWVLHGAVNMGLVQTPSGWIAIDTGLDKQAAKALLRHVSGTGLNIIGIVNTHAHADHFGGNAFLLKHHLARVHAPVFESSVMRRPVMEPEYLWQGAKPLPGLSSKFLLAEATPVDVEFVPGEVLTIAGTAFHSIALPGHSHGQAGILVNGVFFAADAYFAEDVVDKHGLPYMVDYVKTLESAHQVREVKAEWYVPGHGVPAHDASHSVEKLIERHQQGFAATLTELKRPATLDDLVANVGKRFDVHASALGLYVLLRTTIAAYLTVGVEENRIKAEMDTGRLVFVAQ